MADAGTGADGNRPPEAPTPVSWEEPDGPGPRRRAVPIVVGLVLVGALLAVTIDLDDDGASGLTVEEGAAEDEAGDEADGPDGADGADGPDGADGAGGEDAPAPAPPPPEALPSTNESGGDPTQVRRGTIDPDDGYDGALPDGPLPVDDEMTLYVFTEGGRHARVVHLQTGEVVTRELEQRWMATGLPPITNEEAVLVQSPIGARMSAVVYRRGLSGEATTLDLESRVIDIDDQAVWAAEPSGGFRARLVRRGLDGREVIDEVDLPASARVLSVADDRIVLGLGGRVIVHDPQTGAGRVVGTGEAVTSAGEHVVWRSCDGSLQCRIESGRIDGTGSLRSIDAVPGTDGLGWTGTPSLSPDGRHLALVPQTAARMAGDEAFEIAVLDLETGETEVVDDAVIPPGSYGVRVVAAWSPDGAWLFTPAASGGVLAWHPESGESRILPVLDGTPVGLAVH